MNRRLVLWLGALALAIAAFAYYFLTSNAGLEPPAAPPQGRTTSEPPAAPSAAPPPADDAAALQKAGCRQSARDLRLYQDGTVPDDIRPRDILSAEVRYCLETGILVPEETAGLDLSD
ncbi:hypothetical protein [Phyllobacterium phragmitis]|uniref:Uncharacterized protein n=1 Tax=Phyllobacterium phragmitis TaxID=2670329 RepID=A0ABQ0GV33_9HYPH